MPLFNDELIRVSDLQMYDSSLEQVTSSQGIDIGLKAALAQDQLASDLLLFLLKQAGRLLPGSWTFSDAMSVRRVKGVSDVIQTSELKRLQAYRTLALIYQDAYKNQSNDRYLAKWQQYESLANGAAKTLYAVGVGLVNNPLVKPLPPTLALVPGSAVATTYFVSVSYVNQNGQEGCASDPASITTTADTLPLITAPNSIANASGWNVYAGIQANGLMRQNATPLPFGLSWTMLATGIVQGNVPSLGQPPDRFVVEDRLISRG